MRIHAEIASIKHALFSKPLWSARGIAHVLTFYLTAPSHSIDEIGKVVQESVGTKILVAVDTPNEEAIHEAMMGIFNWTIKPITA